MRIKQLEYLEAVIETGSINEAAKRLYLTQPSLSSAIKDLDVHTGYKMLENTDLKLSVFQHFFILVSY